MEKLIWDRDNLEENYIIARKDDTEIQINVFESVYEFSVEDLENDDLIEEEFNKYESLKEFANNLGFEIPSKEEIDKMMNS